jgi:hypothetical protein
MTKRRGLLEGIGPLPRDGIVGERDGIAVERGVDGCEGSEQLLGSGDASSIGTTPFVDNKDFSEAWDQLLLRR